MSARPYRKSLRLLLHNILQRAPERRIGRRDRTRHRRLQLGHIALAFTLTGRELRDTVANQVPQRTALAVNGRRGWGYGGGNGRANHRLGRTGLFHLPHDLSIGQVRNIGSLSAPR